MTLADGVRRKQIINDVVAEWHRQDAKWGEQWERPHVDPVLMNRQGGCDPQRMMEEYELPTATRAKFLCDNAKKNDVCTHAHIIVEELCEAIEEAVLVKDNDTTALRKELVQVAACAIHWLEKIDRDAEMTASKKGGAS